MFPAHTTLVSTWVLAAMLSGEEDPERVVPGRPTVGSSTRTVAPGALQLEFGVDYQAAGLAPTEELRLAIPAIIRVGVHERVEVRLLGADPRRWLRGQSGARAQNDVALGAKIRFFEREGRARVSLGVRPELILIDPLRRTARFWAPLPNVLWLLTLAPGQWSIDLNLGARVTATDAGRCCGARSLFTLAAARSFADQRLQVWGEVYARVDLIQGELAELAGDTGLQVWATRRLAFDLGVLVGKAQATFVVAALAGAAVRWGP